MPDPITNMIQRDVERLNQGRIAMETAFKRWDPFGPQVAAQEQAYALLRAAVQKAEEQVNQTFSTAPREVRKAFLKEKFFL